MQTGSQDILLLTVVLPQNIWSVHNECPRFRKRRGSVQTSAASDLKKSEWISFAMSVHQVSKCTREQRACIEDLLDKHQEQEAENELRLISASQKSLGRTDLQQPSQY